MAHYALLDSNNIVTRVILGNEESDTSKNWELFYENLHRQVCKRTSYNTIGGIHLGGGTPFRKNYAGIGYIFDSTRDAFIIPKPFPSWILDEDTCLWEAPVAYPTEIEDADGNHIFYSWDEDNQQWHLP